MQAHAVQKHCRPCENSEARSVLSRRRADFRDFFPLRAIIGPEIRTPLIVSRSFRIPGRDARFWRPPQSGGIKARTGLRMMPTFP